MSRGRPSTKINIEIQNKILEILKEDAIYRQDLIRKAANWYYHKWKPPSDSDKKKQEKLSEETSRIRAENIVKKTYDKYKEKEISSIKDGRRVIYVHPSILCKAYELIDEPITEDNLSIPPKYIPTLKQWLEQLPDFDTDDFGVWLKNLKSEYLNGEAKKDFLADIDKIIYLESHVYYRTFFGNPQVPDGTSQGQLDIECDNPFFDEVIGTKKSLFYLWNNFKDACNKLADDFYAFTEEIRQLIIEELPVPISPVYAITTDSVGGDLIHLLRKIAYAEISDRRTYVDEIDRIPRIYGVFLPHKTIEFLTTSNFYFNGTNFQETSTKQWNAFIGEVLQEQKSMWNPIQLQDYQKSTRNTEPSSHTTTSPFKAHVGSNIPHWENADTYVFFLNQWTPALILSRRWILDTYQLMPEEQNATKIVHIFDNFFVNHFNNLLQKMREPSKQIQATQLYEKKQKAMRLHRELRATITNIIAATEFGPN
jgi:hypothetical protein